MKKNFPRVTGILILFLLCYFSFPVFLSRAWCTELKIGYVDLFKALNESKKGLDAKKTLEDIMKGKQEEINKRSAEIEKLQEEIEKQASVLTPEARKEKEEKRDRLFKDYQRIVRDFQDEIKKREGELTQEILKDLREIINKIGESEGYGVIFEAAEGILLYVPKQFDITERVIKEYNETIKTTKTKK